MGSTNTWDSFRYILNGNHSSWNCYVLLHSKLYLQFHVQTLLYRKSVLYKEETTRNLYEKHVFVNQLNQSNFFHGIMALWQTDRLLTARKHNRLSNACLIKEICVGYSTFNRTTTIESERSEEFLYCLLLSYIALVLFFSNFKN